MLRLKLKRAIIILRNEGLITLLKKTIRFVFIRTIDRILAGRFQFRFITLIRYKFHNFKYHASTNPYETIIVPTSEINHYVDSHFSRKLGLGQVIGGDWNKHRSPLEKKWIFKGLRQRFKLNQKWHQTIYFNHASAKFEKGKTLWGYRDEEEFLSTRCSYIDTLYTEMKRYGYKPNNKLNHEVPDPFAKKSSYPDSLEVLIVIDSDGSVYLRSGFHRVCLAKIIGIDYIPVQVLARHSKWQKRRDEVAKAYSSNELSNRAVEYLDHPDMEPILNFQDI